MSADNWTICPKCKQTKALKLEQRQKEIEKSYGKVPVAEYLAMLNALAAQQKTQQSDTLREDYEIGIRNDEFNVSYSCRCECGFTFKFEHKEKLNIGMNFV